MKIKLAYVAAALLVLCLALFAACGKDKGVGPGDETYDVDRNGIPQFVRTDYFPLSSLREISKFRSAVGHNYSDDFEQCRSMKHYFWPRGGDPGQAHDPSWSTISILSPIRGTVTRVLEEWAGSQIMIKSADHPAFQVLIFHVTLASPLAVGDAVAEGQVLGHHFGDDTMSDIAVGVSTPGGWKLISYFSVMTDSLFDVYRSYGINSRDDLIISREARDADPLTCEGDTFVGTGTLENWVILD